VKITCINKITSGRLPFYSGLAVSLAVFAACMMPSALRAETYSKILIYPEHVGVFYNIGQQQFEAYGITPAGQKVRITEKVDWYLDKYPLPIQTMKPEQVAVIGEKGLLKVKSTWGRVKVKACYPKGCGPSSPKTPVGGLGLLLK